MAQYPCPQCGEKMFIEAVHEGYEVPCPHCGDRFRVPRGAAAGVYGGVPDAPAAEVPGVPDASGAEEAQTVDRTANPDFDSGSLEVEAPGPSSHAAVIVAEQTGPPPGSDDVVPPRPAVRGVGGPPVNGQDPQATLILVFGILGLVACQILAPVAWIMGHKGRERARARGVVPDSQVTIGWVLGIVGTILWVLFVCIYAAFVAFFLAQA